MTTYRRMQWPDRVLGNEGVRPFAAWWTRLAVAVLLPFSVSCTSAESRDRDFLATGGARAAVTAAEVGGGGVAESGAGSTVADGAVGPTVSTGPDLERAAGAVDGPPPAAGRAAVDAAPFVPQDPQLTYTAVPVPGPYVAMTFDDGPHPRNTPRLLDMLRERGIKATFYVVGQNVERYPEIVARMVAEGHEVGNHSWSHPYFTRIPESAVRSQLERTRDAIVAAGGVAPTTMRPPYGAITTAQKRWIRDDFGYPTVMWSVDPMDWRNRNAPTVTRRILDGTKQGAIILAHDIHKSTVDAMPATLDGLAANGYRFATVSEIIALSQSAPTPPEVASTRPVPGGR